MTTRKRRALWEALLKNVKPVPRKHWPKFSQDFAQMNDGLQKAVESAVMRATEIGTVDDWRWDPHDRVFRFVVRAVLRTSIQPGALDITTRFSFDPRESWRGEVERVMIEAEAFVRKLRETIERKDL